MLVASVVIIVWAQFDAARRAVDHEAGDVATLFRLAAGLPDPYDEQLISAVREYTQVDTPIYLGLRKDLGAALSETL